MNRPNWYSDDEPRGGRFQVPPLRMWSGTQQLLTILVVTLFLQLTLDIVEWIQLDADSVRNPLQWYRFVSYALAHDQGDILHLAFNALTIWFFGRDVESDLGSKRAYYGFCAAAAAFSGLSWLAIELMRSDRIPPLIGASGICYALIVAFAATDPQRIVVLWIFPMKAWALALVVMLLAFFKFLMTDGDQIAHVAHLGGGVFGFLAVRYRRRIEDFVDTLERRRVVVARQREAELRREVDRLLDKINQSGMTSLSRAERRFLETASKELQKRR